MGEQSVGKSFTLNHLVDTSFAGSAMRTTGLFRAVCYAKSTQLSVRRGGMDVRVTYGGCAHSSAGFRRWDQMHFFRQVHGCLKLMNNRRPQSRAYSAGGHASRTFQHCYLKSRV